MARTKSNRWNTWSVDLLTGYRGEVEGSRYTSDRRRARNLAREIKETGGACRVRRACA